MLLRQSGGHLVRGAVKEKNSKRGSQADSSKPVNKRKRTHNESGSEYYPSDLDTNFESEAHRPKAKRQKVAETSKQTTFTSWLCSFGQNVFQTATQALQTEAESYSQSSSRRGGKPRGSNVKTNAPLLVNKNFKEER